MIDLKAHLVGIRAKPKDKDTKENKVNYPRTSKYLTSNTSKTKTPPADHTPPSEHTHRAPLQNSISRPSKPRSTHTTRSKPHTPLTEEEARKPKPTRVATEPRPPLTMRPVLVQTNTITDEVMLATDQTEATEVGEVGEEEEGEGTEEAMMTMAAKTTEMTEEERTEETNSDQGRLPPGRPRLHARPRAPYGRSCCPCQIKQQAKDRSN